MWSSFVAVFIKELKHVLRDRGTLTMFFMLPIMQLSLFGFLDTNVKDLPIAIVDQDNSRVSRELIEDLKATKTFAITDVSTGAHAGTYYTKTLTCASPAADPFGTVGWSTAGF